MAGRAAACGNPDGYSGSLGYGQHRTSGAGTDGRPIFRQTREAALAADGKLELHDARVAGRADGT